MQFCAILSNASIPQQVTLLLQTFSRLFLCNKCFGHGKILEILHDKVWGGATKVSHTCDFYIFNKFTQETQNRRRAFFIGEKEGQSKKKII
jgi:hypothetical protein